MMSVLVQREAEVGQDLQKGSLMHFHRRPIHLSYDTIIKMTEDTASVIQLTDKIRVNRLACAEGEKTKNRQSRKDTGRNHPLT